jgi:excisionase family DNA binding protein
MEASFPTLALRAREAAEILSVSERTLWTWTRAGVVPCKKVGGVVLYSVADLQKWLTAKPAEGGAK